MAIAESGLQLMARLTGRPSIVTLDNQLFYDGLVMGDTILLTGEPSTGKSMLLFKLIADCILPKAHGSIPIPGLEANVILIETDHNNSITLLVSMLERILMNVPPLPGTSSSGDRSVLTRDEKKTIIGESLKRLILLKTYSSDQLILNFYAVGKLMAVNRKVSLIAVDTISAFYWQDVVKLNGLRKKDLYLKTLMQKLETAVKEYKIVTIIVRPANFQSKVHKPNIGQCRYVVELTKNGSDENGQCLIRSGTAVKTISYSLSKEECGSASKYEELVTKIKQAQPEAVISGRVGRQGSFQVTINDKPVYSKLATLAYPDFEAVTEMVSLAAAGQEPRQIQKQQPITDCCVM